MKKLWKVTVNNWTWNTPKTLYFESREEAQKAAETYPAHDNIEYAGNFTDEKADRLTGKKEEW